MLLALTSCWPGGTFEILNRPSASTTAPSDVPVMVTCAVVIGTPLRASVTRPTTVPVWASNGTATKVSVATAIPSRNDLRALPALNCRYHTGPPGTGRRVRLNRDEFIE